MNSFDDKLTCVRYLKGKHETLNSIRNKKKEELKVDIETNTLIAIDDACIDSIIKAFEIFEQQKR